MPRILAAEPAHLDEVVTALLKPLAGGDWIFLIGNLGTGKTTLTKHVVAQLDSRHTATSPTFSIVDAIDLQSEDPRFQRIVHVDLYRLESPRDIVLLGIENLVNEKTLCIFEWADVLSGEDWEEFLAMTQCLPPKNIAMVNISYPDDADAPHRLYELEFLQQ